MSKVRLLLDVVSDMRALADRLEAVCEAMAENEGIEPKETATTEKEPTKKEVSLEGVRAKLAEKSRAGFTAEVREIISKYGSSKLSGIDPKHYAAILRDAEVLGNE